MWHKLNIHSMSVLVGVPAIQFGSSQAAQGWSGVGRGGTGQSSMNLVDKGMVALHLYSYRLMEAGGLAGGTARVAELAWLDYLNMNII